MFIIIIIILIPIPLTPGSVVATSHRKTHHPQRKVPKNLQKPDCFTADFRWYVFVDKRTI